MLAIIGSEISARHNAFMFSVIESCKMIKRNVEDYLKVLFRRLRTAKEGEVLTCCLPCYISIDKKIKNTKKIILLTKPLEISG